MVENGRKYKEHIYGRLLYLVKAIVSHIITNANLFIGKHLYIYILM